MRSGTVNLAEEVERFFDRGAAAYDRAYADPGPGGRILRKRAAVVLDLLGDGPGELLDAGMGGGFLCAALDRRGWAVSGVDLAPAMVDVAQARLPHIRGRMFRGSINALPFSDERFDAVVATGVLEFVVDDLDGAVRELARVLRRDGEAVVSFPNQRAPVNMWRGRVLYPLVRAAKRLLPADRPPPPRVPLVPFRRLLTGLERAGLVIDAVEPVGVRPLPASVGERLERSRSGLAFALAVQLVVRARKAT